MSTPRYVRILRLGSIVVEGESTRRRGCKKLESLRDGGWIEGELIKPIRIGEGFGLRTLFHNGQLCRRLYLTTAVVSIQGDQVLTFEARYKFLRVPVFDPERSLKSWD